MNSKFINFVSDVAKSLAGKPVPIKYLFTRSKENGTGKEELLSLYRDYGVVPKVSRDDNFNKASDDLTKYQIVEPGYLVVNKMKAWQGSLAISGYRGIISPAYFVYRPTSDIATRYFHYVLRSDIYRHEFRKISYGVRPSQWDLDPASFNRLPVVYPGHEVASQIADYLDDETAEIDALIADLKYAAELMRLRFDTHLTTLFAGVSDWVSLRRLATLSTGTTPATNSPQEVFDAAGTQWIRPGDIDEERRVVYGTRRLSDAGESQVRVLEGPAVLVVGIGATVGRVGFVEGDFSTNQQITAVLPGSVDAKYLYFALRSLSDFIRQTAHGNTLPIINNAHLGSLRVPLVSAKEQHRISTELDSEMRRTREATEEIHQAISLARERRAALISAVVTGQIDVTQKRKPVADLLEDEIEVRV